MSLVRDLPDDYSRIALIRKIQNRVAFFCATRFCITLQDMRVSVYGFYGVSMSVAELLAGFGSGIKAGDVIVAVLTIGPTAAPLIVATTV